MTEDRMIRTFVATLSVSVAFVAFAFGQTPQTATTGTPYVLQKQVIAAGGGTMTSPTYTMTGTITQPVAGIQESTATDTAYVGFWIPEMLSPTAASASIGGRVVTNDGRGIPYSQLTLTDMFGLSRTAITGQLGYFRFEGLESGQAYILSVSAKQYSFAQPSIVVNLGEDVTELKFTALPTSGQ